MFRKVDDPLQRALKEAGQRAEESRKKLDIGGDFSRAYTGSETDYETADYDGDSYSKKSYGESYRSGLNNDSERGEAIKGLISGLRMAEKSKRSQDDGSCYDEGRMSGNDENVKYDGHSEEKENSKKEGRRAKRRVFRYVAGFLVLYFLLYQLLAFAEVKKAKLKDTGAFDYKKAAEELLEDKPVPEEYLERKFTDSINSGEKDREAVINSSFVPWVKYISGGEKALEYRLSLIENAEESVDLMVYDFEVDETTSILLESLKRASERGVEVRLLIDGFASLFHTKFSYPFAEFAELDNVTVQVYNPVSAVPNKTHFRLHSKMMIVDDEYILLGGRNLSDKFLHLSENDRSGNNDLDLLIRFPDINLQLYDILDEHGSIDVIVDDLAEHNVDKSILKKLLTEYVDKESLKRKNEKNYPLDDGRADKLAYDNRALFTDLLIDNLLSFTACKMYFNDVFYSYCTEDFSSYAPGKIVNDVLSYFTGGTDDFDFISEPGKLDSYYLSEHVINAGMVPSERLFFLSNGTEPKSKSSDMLNMLFTLFKKNKEICEAQKEQADERELNEGSETIDGLAYYNKSKNILFSPYIVLSSDIEDKIKEFSLGDKLEIVTNSPNISPNPFTSSDFIKHREQLENIFPNIKLIDSEPPIHTKAALVSDDLSIVSSMNFDTRSIKINAEIMMIVKGKLAQASLTLNLAGDYVRSKNLSTVDIERNSKWYRSLFYLLTFLRDLY